MHTESPDLVLENGNIITMDPDRGKAQAIAIKNGKFLAIGVNKDSKRADSIHFASKSIQLIGCFCYWP